MLPINTPSRRRLSFLGTAHPSRQDYSRKATFCLHCQEIFDTLKNDARGSLEFEYHGPSDLKEAAYGGCQFCLLVLNTIAPKDNTEPLFHEQSTATNLKVLVSGSKLYVQDEKYSVMFKMNFAPHTRDVVAEPSPKPSSTGSQESFNLIRTWLHTCANDHDSCKLERTKSQEKPWRPLRLLRIKKRESGGIIVTLDESSDQEQELTYLTLSYCWGKKPVLTLKSENYSQFKDKIPVHLLPKTIQDAITITDALGFRHLWVDSCCIIQDSGIDWLTQAGEMAKIYTKSFLNLAATWAKESSDGVFHEMNPCSLSTIPIYRPQNSGNYKDSVQKYLRGKTEMQRLVYESVWSDWIFNSPLAQRAWTLQESMLSDRTVQFARNGIYWECKSSMTSDIGHDSGFMVSEEHYRALKSAKPVHDTQRDLNELEVRWFQWNTLIAEYSKRGLTNKGDKLVAMAGLARHFAHIANFHEEDYVSGLWKPTFPYSLLWRVAEGEAINSPQYGAPSWSWASVTGEIGMEVVLKHRFKDITVAMDIIDIAVNPVGDAYGQIQEAYLRVRAPLARFRDIHRHFVPEYFSFDRTQWSAGSLNFKEYRLIEAVCFLYLDNVEMEKNIDSHVDSMFVLPIFHEHNEERNDFSFTEGLLLKQSLGSRGCYKRVGTFRATTQYRTTEISGEEEWLYYEQFDVVRYIKQMLRTTVLAEGEHLDDRKEGAYEIKIY